MNPPSDKPTPHQFRVPLQVLEVAQAKLYKRAVCRIAAAHALMCRVPHSRVHAIPIIISVATVPMSTLCSRISVLRQNVPAATCAE